MEKSGPIHTCIDSKFTVTGFRSSLTSSTDSINQLFTYSPPFPQTAKNHQKPLQITENLEPIRTCVDSKYTSSGFR